MPDSCGSISDSGDQTPNSAALQEVAAEGRVQKKAPPALSPARLSKALDALDRLLYKAYVLMVARFQQAQVAVCSGQLVGTLIHLSWDD